MSDISGIDRNITTSAVIASTKPEAAKTSVPGKTENSPNPPYIVDLTVTAVVKSRKLQGQTTEQISSSMGIDTKSVHSHLNAKPTEPTFMKAPAQITSTPVDSASSTSAERAFCLRPCRSTRDWCPVSLVRAWIARRIY